MKIACRVLAIAALASIAAVIVLLRTYLTRFDGISAPSAETQSLSVFLTPLFYILLTTSSALSFASGVVAMVAAGQRRQRVWFLLLLLPLLFYTYSGIATFLIPAARELFYTNAEDQFLRLQIFSYVIAPLFTPLVALAYSLRMNHGSQSQSASEAPRDDSDPVELEYSALTDTPAD